MTTENNVDKKSNATKRKTKKEAVENVEMEAPAVPEKRGRGRQAAASKKVEQPAPTSASPIYMDEKELPKEKPQAKGKRGGRKGAGAGTTSATNENDAKDEEQKQQQVAETESEETKADATNSEDKPTAGKRGRKKPSAPTPTETVNDVKKAESPIESQKEVKGGKRGAAKKEKAKEEQQVTNGDVEKVEPVAKKGRSTKGKKGAENGTAEEESSMYKFKIKFLHSKFIDA